jgi:hypothetical protein
MAKANEQYREPYFPSGGSSMTHADHRVTAGSATLMRQAPMTADEYLHSAIDCIDARLGNGYAKAHPELIGAFMQTSAIDFTAGIIARAIEAVADAIESGRG